jgi:small subunit ribosomal protein S11
MADVKEKAEEQAAVKPTGAPAPAAAADTTGEQKADGSKTARPVRAPKGRVVPFGVVHIRATFNNTMISITDSKGGVVAWSSAGRAAFKGSRKSTAFAGSVVAQEAARQAVARGMQEVEVRVQGPGAGRESAIRALTAAGLSITMIKDVTPMPHNGCRARKRRRV